MQTYELELKSEASKSFLSKKAADSMDIDLEKKLSHKFSVKADLETDFNVGLIVGSSGSGKTTLAKKIYGEFSPDILNLEKPLIDQFPKDMLYEEIASCLNGIGLSQVVCWLRPAATLSNGQRFRAEIALQMAHGNDLIIIDEWTSVVDRTVAKAMSHCVQKYARRNNKKIVLLSCHYDVEEWLNPDWVIDCNKQEFFNYRGSLRRRSEKLEFEIKEIDRGSWKNFSKYHYLSEKIPGGSNYFFGLFHKGTQIGFQCFSNYTPHRKGTKKIYHFNRTVIHPDYVGLGLGLHLINQTSELIRKKGYRVMGKFSNFAVYKSLIKDKNWKLKEVQRIAIMQRGATMKRAAGFREKVKTYSFEYTPKTEG